jgi:hypothetical protein
MEMIGRGRQMVEYGGDTCNYTMSILMGVNVRNKLDVCPVYLPFIKEGIQLHVVKTSGTRCFIRWKP